MLRHIYRIGIFFHNMIIRYNYARVIFVCANHKPRAGYNSSTINGKKHSYNAVSCALYTGFGK